MNYASRRAGPLWHHFWTIDWVVPHAKATTREAENTRRVLFFYFNLFENFFINRVRGFFSS
jgi:hypothetical protein